MPIRRGAEQLPRLLEVERHEQLRATTTPDQTSQTSRTLGRPPVLPPLSPRLTAAAERRQDDRASPGECEHLERHGSDVSSSSELREVKEDEEEHHFGSRQP